MSDQGHPDSALRAYRGETRPEEVAHVRAVGPWDGELIITAIELSDGRRFQLDARWTGFLPGTPPPAPGVRPGRATDSLAVDELDFARALLERAREALRAPTPPDLRALAEGLRERQ